MFLLHHTSALYLYCHEVAGAMVHNKNAFISDMYDSLFRVTLYIGANIRKYLFIRLQNIQSVDT